MKIRNVLKTVKSTMSDKKRCYLAGPMSGIPKFNFPAFFEAAAKLEQQGWEVFNPAQADIDRYGVDFSESCPTGSHDEANKAADTPVTYRDCLRADLNYILDKADAIALLPGWLNSQGCKVERALADCLQLEVIHL